MESDASADDLLNRVPIRIKDLIEHKCPLFILGDSEYGLTSILRMLFINMYENCAELAFPQVPCLLDCRHLKDYDSNITAFVSRGIPKSSEKSLTLENIHNAGRLLIVIDDVDPGDELHIRIIKRVCFIFYKAKVIFGVKAPNVLTRTFVPKIGLNNGTLVQASEFNRSRVRALIERWRLPGQYTTNSVIEHLMTKFRSLGIPITGTYLSIYLSVLENIKGYSQINSFTVIEKFVELFLEKHGKSVIFRRSFDSINQVDCLGGMRNL